MPPDQPCVPDLAAFLLGQWRLARRGWNSLPGGAMRMRGVARCSRCADGLLFEESGLMQMGAYSGEAARRYVFQLNGSAMADVRFDDGRLFHRLDLSPGRARVSHHCPPDQYDGRYRVVDDHHWVLSWTVTGPRKRQVITSRFTRLPPA